MCVPGRKSRVRPSLSKRAGGGKRERVGINCLLLPAQKSSWSTTSSSSAGGEREGESLPSGDYQESLEKREKTLLLRGRLETKENQGTTTSSGV